MKDPTAKARAELTAQIVKAIREEIRHEMIVAGIAPIPFGWDPSDRYQMAQRLRALADELDPPAVRRIGGVG